jgi:uncharacterized protein
MACIGASKTIAIDVDSVLADVMVMWSNEYNKRKNANVSKDEIKMWDIPKILPISSEEVYRIFRYVWKYRWKDIPPTEPHIGKITTRIHRKGYRISILTKRERSTVAYVAKWLDFYDVYSDDLLFVYDATPKAEYPFDILIDDAPINLIDIVAPKSAILFNQPWNHNFDWSLRVNSLSEAEQIL